MPSIGIRVASKFQEVRSATARGEGGVRYYVRGSKCGGV